MTNPNQTMLPFLTKHFGHTAFRPGQQSAISNLLSNQNVLAIMPTGSGKSLIYQYAALRKAGLTIVISPLISLMKDQVDKLQSRNIPATFINSTLSTTEQKHRIARMVNGVYKLVYIAPERLRQYLFREEIKLLQVSLLVIDEVHCITQWGYDFRPDYLHIAKFWHYVGQPTVIALTATATPTVQGKIVQSLELPSVKRIVTGFDRPNLKLEVRRIDSEHTGREDKQSQIEELLRGWNEGAVIIYVGTRLDAEMKADFIQKDLGLKAAFYHAGLEAHERKHIQDALIEGRLPIVVATNAFGMGIDRQDVRLVIHHTLPGSIEAYYQEAGRAGRNGKAAQAILLYHPSDRKLQDYFIKNSILYYQDLEILDYRLRADSTVREKVWVNPDELSKKIGFDDKGVKVRVGLQRLEEAGVIEQGHYEGVERLVYLYKWNDSTVTEILEKMETHFDHRKTQLKAMVAYAENETNCRRQLILNHFAADKPTSQKQRCCDVCDAQNERIAFAAEIKHAQEATSEQIPLQETIIDCVREFDQTLTPSKVVEILHGDLKGYSRFTESKFYGKLSKYSRKQIKKEVNRLVDDHILTKDQKNQSLKLIGTK